MDWVFYVFIIVLSIILFIVYFIFHYDGNKDLNEVFKQIWEKDATIKAFTLENTQTGFRNVFIDEKSGLPYISEQKYPVTKSGILITPNDHGVLVDIDDGFQVLGIANTFKCPDGYYTSNCIAKPICTESDAGKTKPITISQFNQLELYGIASSSYSNKYHPRIRVDCLDENGNYKLKYCQDNELLDENNECTPYDICADKLSGFKHNYPTGDNFQLKENEYYTCIDNKSSLNKCPDDLIFSEPNQGCIRNNECYGKGLHQILVDDHNYIQCENDDGRKIHCEQGVENKNNILSCSVDLCTPKEYKYSDKLIEYTYGKTTCENNTHNTLLCDNSSSNFKYTYKWAEVFDVHLPSIPKQALSKDGKYCVDLKGLSRIDDALFNFTENPNIDLAWSKAMHTAHKFNVKTQEYICKEGEYRWDYDYYEIHPKPIQSNIMDTAAPCQTQLYENYFKLLEERQQFAVERFRKEAIKNQYIFLPNEAAPIIFGIAYDALGVFNNSNRLVNWWPIYDPETKTYKCSFIKNKDLWSGTHWLIEYTDSQIPLGFILDTNVSKFDDGTIPLLVAGYSKCVDDIGINYLNKFAWWFIASGEIQPTEEHFSDKATKVTTQI